MDVISAIRNYKNVHGFGGFAPKAVLFDMDGVLYNSMPFHAKAWHNSMARYGIEMSEADAYEYEGKRGVETICDFARKQGKEHLVEIADEIYDFKSSLFASYVENEPQKKPQKMEGVESLMRQMKEDGMKICVVTGSGQHSLLDRLEEDFPGLLHRDLMVTCFDVKIGKPDPCPYLKGLEKCGVQPWEAIVVENAPLGVTSAVAAKIFTIAVNTGPLDDKRLADVGASLVYKKMDDFHSDWKRLLLAAKEDMPPTP